MVAAEPTVQAVTPDGVVLPWWSDRERMRELLMRVALRGTANASCRSTSASSELARHLEPLFMQAPPDLQRSGFAGLARTAALWLEVSPAARVARSPISSHSPPAAWVSFSIARSNRRT